MYTILRYLQSSSHWLREMRMSVESISFEEEWFGCCLRPDGLTCVLGDIGGNDSGTEMNVLYY